MTDHPFERLAFNAEGRLVELSPGVVLREPTPPPSVEWMPATEAAKTRPVTGTAACVTKASGPLYGARIVNEPFTEGGIQYVYCCPEEDFWRWWLTPESDRPMRPKARCWPAQQVWVLKERGSDLDLRDLPPDPFL